MDKLTYLAELAEGLARWVPERERQDILRYYAEYFEEAGPEREAQVVQELGDPWALSSRLAVEGGYVTAEQARSWTPPKRKKWPLVAIGAAAVLVFVIGSVAVAASQIGRAVGQIVSDVVVTSQAEVSVVDEGTAFVYPGGDATYSEGEEFSGSVSVFDAIDADISLGNVTVVVGDDYTLSINRGTDLGGYSLKWEIKDGTLKLRDSGKVNHVEVNSWSEFKELFGVSRQAMEVIITVPDFDVVLDKVSVKTGLGNVLLFDVAAEKVTAETGMGNVECYNSRQVKKMDLDTGMGDVTLGMDEPCTGVDIDLESGMGNVEASLGCSEAECEYELESGMGTVTVDGDNRGGKAERKGNMSYKLDAESGMGDVNVYFN